MKRRLQNAQSWRSPIHRILEEDCHPRNCPFVAFPSPGRRMAVRLSPVGTRSAGVDDDVGQLHAGLCRRAFQRSAVGPIEPPADLRQCPLAPDHPQAGERHFDDPSQLRIGRRRGWQASWSVPVQIPVSDRHLWSSLCRPFAAENPCTRGNGRSLFPESMTLRDRKDVLDKPQGFFIGNLATLCNRSYTIDVVLPHNSVTILE